MTTFATPDVISNLARGYASRDVTADYTVDSLDQLLRCDGTAAGFTVTLPPSSAMPGKRVTLLRMDSASNQVVIDADGTETLGSASTVALDGSGMSVTLQARSDGTGWDRLSEFLSLAGGTITGGDLRIENPHHLLLGDAATPNSTDLLTIQTEESTGGFALKDSAGRLAIRGYVNGAQNGYLTIYERGSGTISLNGVTNGSSFINNGGPLGLGTASPSTSHKLEANGSSTLQGVLVRDNLADSAAFELIHGTNSGSGLFRDGSNSSSLRLYDGTFQGVLITAAGNSWIRGGNLGIGTASPAANVDTVVHSAGSQTGFRAYSGTVTGTWWGMQVLNTSIYGALIRHRATSTGGAIYQAMSDGAATAEYQLLQGATTYSLRTPTSGDLELWTSGFGTKLSIDQATGLVDLGGGTLQIDDSAPAEGLTFNATHFAVGGTGGGSGTMRFSWADGTLGIGDGPHSTYRLAATSAGSGAFLANDVPNGDWAFTFDAQSGSGLQGIAVVSGAGELRLRDSLGAENVYVRGGGDSYLLGGSLGVGTPSPDTDFEVQSSALDQNFVQFSNPSGQALFRFAVNASGHGRWEVRDASNTKVADLSTAAGTANFGFLGYVGAGTLSPDSALHGKVASSGNAPTLHLEQDDNGEVLLQITADEAAGGTHPITTSTTVGTVTHQLKVKLVTNTGTYTRYLKLYGVGA